MLINSRAPLESITTSMTNGWRSMLATPKSIWGRWSMMSSAELPEEVVNPLLVCLHMPAFRFTSGMAIVPVPCQPIHKSRSHHRL